MAGRSRFFAVSHYLVSLMLFFPGMLAVMVYVPPMALPSANFVRGLAGWPMLTSIEGRRRFGVAFVMVVFMTLWGMFTSRILDSVIAWCQSRWTSSQSKSVET